MLWPMQTLPADWQIPDWPAPPQVQALCTSRNGGVSAGAYASCNLGVHVGDSAQDVQTNRARLQAALGVRPVFLDQVHGVQVQELQPGLPDGLAADAAWTDTPNLACTVMVADCLPVLLCDLQGQRVAAAHAGWRGLLGAQGRGVLEHTVERLRAEASASEPLPPLLAWLGPCIGPQAFEVGDAVRDAFVQDAANAAAFFVPTVPGKWLADLPGLARQRLAALGGVQCYGNDGSAGWCTVGNPSRFFSHRRDRISGRMAACIWRSR